MGQTGAGPSFWTLGGTDRGAEGPGSSSGSSLEILLLLVCGGVRAAASPWCGGVCLGAPGFAAARLARRP